jgi:hypothetical protein
VGKGFFFALIPLLIPQHFGAGLQAASESGSVRNLGMLGGKSRWLHDLPSFLRLPFGFNCAIFSALFGGRMWGGVD